MSRVASIIRHLNLLSANPSLISRIATNYVRLLLLNKKVLRKVDIALNFDCNAKCSHCSCAKLEDETRPQLTLKEIKDLIKQSVKLGAFIFELTGGEPLLSEHLYEAIEAAKEEGAIVGVTTNGLMLTREVIEELRKVRLDVVQISIDSANPGEHDRSRGVNGCFERALRNLGLLKETGFMVILSTILTPQNIADKGILKIIQLAGELDVLLSITPSIKAGGWSCNEAISLTQEDKKFYERLASFPHLRWTGYYNFLKKGCPCGRETIFVSAYGDVLPCSFIHISYGNIREESLEQSWKRMYALSFKSQVCMAGLDREFMETHLEPLSNKNELPLSIFEHPVYKKES